MILRETSMKKYHSPIVKITKTPRMPRSVNGDEWRFWIRI